MQLLRFIGLLVVALFILWVSWNCKDEISGGGGLEEIVFPESNVSYSQHVQPLFDRGCGGQTSACHGPETFEVRGYSFDSYIHATNSLPRRIIIVGDPDASLLNSTIEGRSPPKMPPISSPQLTQNQIKGMRTWVKEFARDN